MIIDFVMNHTSDAHPWFQASREDPEGPYGDFYVWSDTDELYEDARVIFVDTEPSNWTWDPVRQQYFWHRFFSHQPDLNFDNPKVHDAMLEAMAFWLDMGHHLQHRVVDLGVSKLRSGGAKNRCQKYAGAPGPTSSSTARCRRR